MGAVLALPIASGLALILALWLLRPFFRASKIENVQKVSLSYSLLTLVGLGSLRYWFMLTPFWSTGCCRPRWRCSIRRSTSWRG
ncbi:MAG: hypothetical protein M5U34_43860 [Chloroflexi bacterium]|nr:hypothetical protein [Chloroflexota bacterium]